MSDIQASSEQSDSTATLRLNPECRGARGMTGPCGYGRYDDDPEHVGCPRARSDMTPCIARDGAIALAPSQRDPAATCVGCNRNPLDLLQELRDAGVTIMGARPKVRDSAADRLRELVREIAEPRDDSRIGTPPSKSGG